MNYTITYLSFEGNVRTILIEDVDSEDEAIDSAYAAQGNYSGDNIHKIIEVTKDLDL